MTLSQSQEVRHTPGPWEVLGVTKIAKTGEGGAWIAILCDLDSGPDSRDAKEARYSSPRLHEAHANARLIAQAPALLAELKTANPLLLTLCSIALRPELADYLPFGTLEQVKEWLRTNKAGAVIRAAEEGQ